MSISRKQKVEELMESIHSLKHHIALHSISSGKMPRITPSQWGALIIVKQHGESTVKDMAKMLGISSSAATQLVDGLVASGYLVREVCVKDRRIVTLTLSKKTKTQVNKMKKQVLQHFIKLFEVLNDKELEQFILLSKKIVERLFKDKKV